MQPNGTIVTVDAADDPDMAVALRGSGSEFGIITKYTLTTYPIGQVSLYQVWLYSQHADLL